MGKPMSFLKLCLFSLIATDLSATDTQKKVEATYNDVQVNTTLAKILELDGVKPHYQSCKTSPPDKIADCIWKGLANDKETKKKVMAIYNAEIKNEKSDGKGRTPASSDSKRETTTSELTGKVIGVGVNKQSDPAIMALSAFYEKKLDEVLDPTKALTADEQREGMVLTVDHRKFSDLYKSQLGKTVIAAFTSYCLDTNPSTHSNNKFEIDSNESTMKGHREKNLDTVKASNIDLSSGGSQSEVWTNCIKQVAKNCEIGSDETKRRACIVTDYVKAARKNIMITDEHIKFYKDLEKQGTVNMVTNAKEINDPNKASSDALLQINSKDVEDNLKKVTAENIKEFEECQDKKNLEICKKFINTNTDQNNAAIAEFGLRQNAKEEELREVLNSKDKVVQYLKEEGYKQDEIDAMLKDPKGLGDIKTKITDRFNKEKEAIIAEMAKRITSKTSKTDGKIDFVNDKSTLDKIKIEISNRPKELSELIRFNNIVSSYLEIEDSGTKVKSRNTASLFSETAALSKEDQEKMKTKLDKAKLKDEKSNAELELKTINDNFLNYKP
jgi:hypothetical protein